MPVANREAVSRWWDSVRHDLSWCGALQGTAWEDLWDEAREELSRIYAKAVLEQRNSRNH